MTRPAAPTALLDWQDGQPLSRRFGDVYFSRDSGLEETRHVFLAGNALEARWARLAPRDRFVVGETGFGTGLNFLCAWQLWARAAPPDARLHFVSVERYPLPAAELRRALDLWPELAACSVELLRQWTDFPPGWHRLAFAHGRVQLTLVIGDVRAALPRLDAAADAWFLDGFAPAKNPDMWCPEVLAEVARCSRPGATCATYTVAGEVRRGLEAAGFGVDRAPGFGRKREMLRGALRAPRGGGWSAPWFARPPRDAADRHALVVGGGLAGAATASSLAARGWTVDLVERGPTLAAEASGNPQAVLYARLSPHGTALGELCAAGLQYTRGLIDRLPLEPHRDFDACGVLQLAHDAAEAERHERLAALGLPQSVLRRLDRTESSTLAGVALPTGGLLLPRAGWAHPPALCRVLGAHPAVRVRVGCETVRLRRLAQGWEAIDDAGRIIRARAVVICGAGASAGFAETRWLPLRRIRGQLTLVPATPASSALHTVLSGDGYAAPARAGRHGVGATHKFHDASTALAASEHAENLARLARLAPALYGALGGALLDPARLDGWAGVRCSTPDYLPLIGPLADAAAFALAYAPLARDATLRPDTPSPWLDGLYANTAHGSRGLVTAPLAGEIVAAYLDGEPAPLPRSVMEAVHPSRFPLRGLIRRRGGRTVAT